MKRKAAGTPRKRKRQEWREGEPFPFDWLRSAPRRETLKWRPIWLALERQKRPAVGRAANVKWEYQCQRCGHWFLKSQVRVDHIIECGSLRGWDELS